MCTPTVKGPLSPVSLKLLLQDKVADLEEVADLVLRDALVLGVAKFFFPSGSFGPTRTKCPMNCPAPGRGST